MPGSSAFDHTPTASLKALPAAFLLMHIVSIGCVFLFGLLPAFGCTSFAYLLIALRHEKAAVAAQQLFRNNRENVLT
jgi:hypothetical protein